MRIAEKFKMCRLCLCDSRSLINVFRRIDRQQSAAGELISDLLQFEVSFIDGYPHFVCCTCLEKLTNFNNFKNECINFKNIFDKNHASLRECRISLPRLETVKVVNQEREETEVTVKSEDISMLGDPWRVTTPKVNEVIFQPQNLQLEESVPSVNQSSFQPEDLHPDELIISVGNQRSSYLGNLTAEEVISADVNQLDFKTGDVKSQNAIPVAFTKEYLGPIPLKLIKAATGKEVLGQEYLGPIPLKLIKAATRKEVLGQEESNVSILGMTWSEELDLHGSDAEKKRMKNSSEKDTNVAIKKRTLIKDYFSIRDIEVETNKDEAVGDDLDGNVSEAPSNSHLEDESDMLTKVPDKRKIGPTKNEADGRDLDGNVSEAHSITIIEDEPVLSTTVPNRRRKGSNKKDTNVAVKKRTLMKDYFSIRNIEVETNKDEIVQGRRTRRKAMEKALEGISKVAEESNESGSASDSARDQEEAEGSSCEEIDINFSTGESPKPDSSTCTRKTVPNEKNTVQDITLSKSKAMKVMRARINELTNSFPGKVVFRRTSFACIECDKVFPKTKLLGAHMIEHGADSSAPFKCTVCKKKFADYNSWTTHKKIHLKKVNPNKSTALTDTVTEHQQRWIFNRIFKCDKCHKTFKTVKLLDEHMIQHGEGKPYECLVCGKDFMEYAKWKSHIKIHVKAEFGCSKCDKRFFTKNGLNFHMDKHLGLKRFQCKVCNKRFFKKNSLNTHMVVHEDKMPYECDECHMTFSWKYNMWNHILLHIDRKKLTCEECGKVSSTIYSLKYHKKIHRGISDFLCNECGKTFRTHVKLKMHLLVHSGQKPFACDQCDKTFNRKDNLQLHKSVHSENKSFICEKCGKCFSRKVYLKYHKRIHER